MCSRVSQNGASPVFAVQYHIVRKRFYIGLFLIAGILFTASEGLPAQEDGPFSMHRARVAVPVADLRKEPIKPQPSLDHDPLEESQLLYGDLVEVLEEKEGWARVSALEQDEWSHNKRWEGYPGWIELSSLRTDPIGWKPNLVVTAKSASLRLRPEETIPAEITLSIGTRLYGRKDGTWWQIALVDGTQGWIHSDQITSLSILAQRDSSTIRNDLVQTARQFLGDPYYWGGRSGFLQESQGLPPHRAVDCSGLVGLVYQANGISIPRDAHEQWMRAKAISKKQLKPGDLIFLHHEKDPSRITHVMIYVGNGRILEGPGSGKGVWETDLATRLEEERYRRISFGSFLS